MNIINRAGRRARTPACYLKESHPDRSTWNALMEFVHSKLIKTTERPTNIERSYRGEPDASVIIFKSPKPRHMLRKELRTQDYRSKSIYRMMEEVQILVDDDEDGIFDEDKDYEEDHCERPHERFRYDSREPDPEVRFAVEFNYSNKHGYSSSETLYVLVKWNPDLAVYELVKFEPMESC